MKMLRILPRSVLLLVFIMVCCNSKACKSEDEVKYVCKPDCKNTCKNINNTEPMCQIRCSAGCFCKPGLVKREIDGKCIPPSQCRYVACPNKDEVEYKCKPECKNTCKNFKNPNAICTAICVMGCFCRPGLVKRESDGKCVKPEACSYAPCENDKEVQYFCKPDCKNTCRNYNNSNVVCPTWCKLGCFCRPGLVKRERDGECVLPHQCNHEPCPSANEIEYFCKPFCKNTCKNYNNPNAVCPAVCSPGCFCKPGLVKRESDGRCVRPKQCENVQCPENEELSNCVVTCNDCKTRGRCKFLVCNKGCDCIKGYYKDKNRKCIPQEQCPVEINCPVDEEYYPCVPTCNNTCRNYGKNIPCLELCRAGCFCKKGLVLNSRGKCVPPEKCKNDLCRSDEEFYNCAPICNTCRNYNRPVVVCPKICRIGCFCKRGLLLRRDGRCVTPKMCPPRRTYPVKKPHPVGSRSLDGSYRALDGWNPSSGENFYPYNYPEIFRGNDTEDSYRGIPLLAKGTESIPDEKEDFSKSHQCRSDEEYYNCAPICNTCRNYNRPRAACPLICRIGCFCKRGLLLREDGRCVTPEMCPPRRTHPVGFRSLDGSYRAPDGWNPNSGENVQPHHYPGDFRGNDTEDSHNEIPLPGTESVPAGKEDLSKKYTCGRNEEYYTCAPVCQICENYNKTDVYCPPVCQRGCFCQKGFLKRNDGLCVLPEECPQNRILENVDPFPEEDDRDPYESDYYDQPSYYFPDELV